jgi:peptidoglycan/xylan/chitin deacetylase (PgdA/CDA1 family)
MNVLPLDQALADLDNGRPLPARAVALTFDDGYLDAATHAAPRLRALGLPATFFLVPGFLSGTEACWWEDLAESFTATSRTSLRWDDEDFDLTPGLPRLAARAAIEDRLKHLDRAARRLAVDEIMARLSTGVPPRSEPLFMGWEHARALQTDGFTIGSHTMSHPILSREVPAEQDHQLSSSKKDLEAELGVPVDLLAYPNGREADYDADTVSMAEQAGYRHAVTTRSGRARPDHPPYDVRRHVVGPEDDIASVLREVAGTFRQKVSSAVSRGPGRRPGR